MYYKNFVRTGNKKNILKNRVFVFKFIGFVTKMNLQLSVYPFEPYELPDVVRGSGLNILPNTGVTVGLCEGVVVGTCVIVGTSEGG